MKAIGAIALLILLATSCQKEDIRPNTGVPSAVRAESSGSTLEEDGTSSTGGGITDPNDANRNTKNPKPKQ